MAEKQCKISRQQFTTAAKYVEIKINGVPGIAGVKEFSTGSLGWYHTGKMTVKVGEVLVDVQVGLNMTIIGSKELPETGDTAFQDEVQRLLEQQAAAQQKAATPVAAA